MKTLVLPSAEVVAIQWLLLHDDVTSLVDDRVRSESKEDEQYPFVTIQRIGGAAAFRHIVDRAVLQIDVRAAGSVGEFGSAREAARGICEQVVAVLHEIERRNFEGAWITAVDDLVGPRPMFDELTKINRFQADVRMTLRASPEAS